MFIIYYKRLKDKRGDSVHVLQGTGGAIGFLLYPKARQHARLLLPKVKSILTLLLKICAQHLIAFEVLYRHLRMAYKALQLQLSGSHTVVCTDDQTRRMGDLLRCTFLGTTMSHSSSVGLG